MPDRDRRTVGGPEAVRMLSRITGGRYRLVGRLAGGETGAHEVAGPDGRRLVAKWELDPTAQRARRRAVGLSDRLRVAAGWPVPRLETVETDGCLFVLQELRPGSPVTHLTHALVDRLLELHRSRVGLELPADNSSWPEELVRTLVTGGNGYCRHESLRRYDRRTAAIVERAEAIGGDLDPGDLAGGDVVHWDLHPGNLLALDGDLTAVVDTDFVTTGDAAFDLATLAVASLVTSCQSGVRARLLELGVDRLDPVRRQAYVAHLLVRVLDWPIRRGRLDEVEAWVAHADRLLPA